MKIYEAQIICENLQYSDRAQWDSIRLLAYIYTLSNAKKGTKLTPEDIVRYPWDRTIEKAVKRGMTDEEFTRLSELAKTFKDNR